MTQLSIEEVQSCPLGDGQLWQMADCRQGGFPAGVHSTGLDRIRDYEAKPIDFELISPIITTK
ncbi:hypothetical protein [Bradyrhizobium sp. Bra64]|uniref:hypothetical protein n=1 Tax=Bradyrhizobium sp. Bra64 TaxID=2926009 RepID=UPI0021190F29|nr:hypothetical protein [Bradyrhizobium sp. Bra64]